MSTFRIKWRYADEKTVNYSYVRAHGAFLAERAFAPSFGSVTEQVLEVIKV